MWCGRTAMSRAGLGSIPSPSLALIIHGAEVCSGAYPRKGPPDLLFLTLLHVGEVDQEGTREVNRNSVLNVDVECGGTQVVAHAGLHALGGFADRIGLGAALSTAVPWSGERAPTHDRGTVLTHAMLMLAAGGEACSDIELLASQPRLFGEVASDSTLYRTIRNITPTMLADLTPSVVRARVRTRGGMCWRKRTTRTTRARPPMPRR